MGQEPGGDYWATLQLDPELAELRRDLPRTTRPSLRGYTREVSVAMDITDVLIAARADPKSNFTGIPRPLTGIDLLAARERNYRMADIVAKATPKEV